MTAQKSSATQKRVRSTRRSALLADSAVTMMPTVAACGGTGRTSKDGFTQAPQKDGALTVRGGGTSTPPSRHRTTVWHLTEGPLRTVTAPTEVPVVPDRRDDNHGAAGVHELPTDGAGSRIHALTARPLTASRTAVRAAWTVLRARRCLVPCSCHCR